MIELVSSNMSFGCMQGQLCDASTCNNTVPVVVELFSHRNQRFKGSYFPRAGDILCCTHMYHTVFSPQLVIRRRDLLQNMYLGRILPNDLLQYYFDIRHPLAVVTA